MSGNDPHERIDELLAGYALGALSGEDAAETDRLLAEHVPGCARCRATLLAFSDTAAELGLVPEPLDPPDLLLARLHREMEPRGRRPVARWTGVAAGVAIAVVGAGLALSQTMQASDLRHQSARMNDLLQFIQRHGASTDQLVESRTADVAPMSEVTAPDVGYFYLLGTDVPPPPPGTVYGIWLSDGTQTVFAGVFPWGPDVRVVRVPFDRSRFDRVLVTVEEVGGEPDQPGPTVWEAAA
jgi:anti-sigma-K factor RskA